MVEQLVQRFENESIVKPYWLYPALQQLRNLSLFHEHERWAAASGALFLESAKMDIEGLRVRGNIGGFDWWLIQDYYTGSNGILDSFLSPKPGIADSPAAIQTLQGLLNQTALLLAPLDGQATNALPLAFRGGQELNTAVAVSTFTPGLPTLDGAKLKWTVTLHRHDAASGRVNASVVASDTVSVGGSLPAGEVIAVANVTFKFPVLGTFPTGGRSVVAAARVTLDAELSSSDGVALAHNRWRTTLFPSFKDGPATDFGIKLWSTSDLMDGCMFNDCAELPPSFSDAEPAPQTNSSHRNVILLTGSVVPASAIQLLSEGAAMVFVQNSSSDFWPSIPTHFKSAWWLGTATDNNCGSVAYTELPACANVTAGMIGPDGFGSGSDAWLDRSWHELVDGAQTIDLAKLPAQPQVLIRALDIAGAGPRSKSLLAAFSVGKGTAFVTGLNILQGFASQTPQNYFPDKAWLLFQLIRFASTGEAKPSQQLPLESRATCDCWFGVCTAPANCSVAAEGGANEQLRAENAALRREIELLRSQN